MKNLEPTTCSPALHELCLKQGATSCPICAWTDAHAVTKDRDPKTPRIVILQHPQEPKESLGSAWMAPRLYPKWMDLKVGLSRKSISQLIDLETSPKDWAVVYPKSTDAFHERGFTLFQPKGKPPIQDTEQLEILKKLKGFVFLDGTWAQSKTLWWRNPWVLKSLRLSLHSKAPSRYGVLRKEPNKAYLSTLESIAHLEGILGFEDVAKNLTEGFEEIVKAHPVRKGRPSSTRRN